MKCRLLLVEDEYEIRQGIRLLLDWDSHGFEIIGEAGNGLQALELLARQQPHILLTDIRMPGMDGVELTKTVQMRYPQIKVVVLSGYSDYEYVRSCFQFGAVDYILKPMLSAGELLSVLEKAAGLIPGLSLERGAVVTPENLLQSFLSGADVEERALSERCLPGPFYQLMAMDVPYVLGKMQDMGQCQELLRQAGAAVLPERQTVSLVLENRKLLLCCGASQPGQTECDALKKIAEKMAGYLGDGFWVAGEAVDSWKKLRDQWREELSSQLQKRFYYRRKIFLPSWEIRTDHHSPEYDRKRFETFLNDGRMMEVVSMLLEHTGEWIRESRFEEHQLKSVLHHALYQVIDYLEGTDLPQEEIMRMRRSYVVRINNARFAEELLRVLEEIGKELEHYCLLERNPSPEDILGYIEEHYSENLTLAMLAEKFSFNYSYLSAYFSAHYQKNFTEYLNTVRIEKARQLLREGELTVAEVGERVGYTDNSYFSGVFKKHTGVTPTLYRRELERRR